MKVKQVIVVRKDLDLPRGMLCAQVAHASVKVFLDRRDTFIKEALIIPLTPAMQAWVEGKFYKVVLQAKSREALHELHRQAQEAGLPCAVMEEELTAGDITALAIGPAENEEIDKITGKLQVLKD